MSASSYTSRSSTVIAVNAALMGIMGVFVAIRSWARIFRLHQVGIDDVLVWVASVCFLLWRLAKEPAGLLCTCIDEVLTKKHVLAFLLAIMEILMANNGLGHHIEDVSAAELTRFFIFDFVSAIAYIWSFVLIKLSFAFFYLRVIPNKRFRRLNSIVIAVLAAQGIEETFVVCFSCQPIYKFWTPEADGKCLILLKFYYISFGIKFLTDVILFLEPLPFIVRLNLPTVKKIGLLIMFSLGLLTCVISIIRATYLNDTAADITWGLVDPINWSTAEVASLIICACIPFVRNLLAEIPALNKALGLSSGHSKGYATTTDPELSFALQARRSYVQSRNLRPDQGSVPALATASPPPCEDHLPGRIHHTESTEEIFPSYMGHQGGIVVSTDVKVAVENPLDRTSFSGSWKG